MEKRRADTAEVAPQPERRLRSELAGRLSHDLRTPLGSLLLYADALAHDPGLSPEGRSVADRLQASGRRVMQVLEAFVDFARVEAGEAELEPSSVALRPVGEELVSLAALTHPGRKADLRFTLAADAPKQVWADEARLRQVLGELLENACRFTTSGIIELSVRAAAEQRVGFAVSDAGPGIPCEQRELAFTPYWRGSRGADGRGSGLGLPVARALVRGLGGELRLEDVPGGGCRFSFELPEQAPAGG